MAESPEMMAHVFSNSMAEFAKPYLEADPRYAAETAEDEREPEAEEDHGPGAEEILARHGIRLVPSDIGRG